MFAHNAVMNFIFIQMANVIHVLKSAQNALAQRKTIAYHAMMATITHMANARSAIQPVKRVLQAAIIIARNAHRDSMIMDIDAFHANPIV